MMDGDLLMILTVTVNVMMMMMTIKMMIMERGSCPLAKIKTEVCTGTLLSGKAPKALPLCILMRFEIS